MNKKTQFKPAMLLIALLMLAHLSGQAQYYFQPKPVPESSETALRAVWKRSVDDKEKLKTALSLANFCIYRYARKTTDLTETLSFAQVGLTLAAKLNDIPAKNEAAILLCMAYTQNGEFSKPEELLPTVNDTARIQLLHVLSSTNFIMSNFDDDYFKRSVVLAQKAINLSAQIHNREMELLSQSLMGLIHVFDKKLISDTALINIVNNLKSIKSHHLYSPYLALACYYNQRGLFSQVISNCQLGITAVNNGRDSSALGDLYFIMALALKGSGKNERSIDYFKKTIAQYAAYRSPERVSASVSIACGALNYLKRYREAIAFLQYYKTKYPPQAVTDAAAYDEQIGKNYQAVKDYGQAGRHLLSAYNALKAANQLNTRNDQSMAQFFVETKQYQKARPFITSFFERGKTQTVGVGTKSHLEYLSYLVDSAAHDYRSAMLHLEQSKLLDNSYLTEKKNSELQQLEVKYETKEKEAKINQLQQKAELEQARAQQKTAERNLFLGGLLLAIIILGLLWRQNLLSKKNRITIERKNSMLQRLITEKEWLLKEVHHRVKNNLHTVICLLESQAAYLENDALAAIESSQHRIYAMSLIHQKLYQADDIKTIDMDVYLNEFLRYLEDSYGNPETVSFQYSIESIKLGAAQAIPVGLIINEAVTNSFKYAFPDGRQGRISVGLHQSDDLIELLISDDGIGMKVPDGFEETSSLGMELIKGLANDLKAEIKIDGKNGVSIRVLFESTTFDQTSSTLESVLPA